MQLQGKHILLGITGGIAAYKSANLLRLLQQQGAEVRVIATPSALRFIGEETLKALSRNEVAIHIFSDSPQAEWTKHIHWGEWADLMVIAPCTANSMAKIAHGFSDNMLTATVLALRAPLLICPTMDGEMLDAASTQRNLVLLQEYGFHLLEPEFGYLASGLEAKGRLPEPDAIIKKIQLLLSDSKTTTPPLLKGKKVLITVGATREFFDPVRFISNPSTGKMGMSLAEAALNMGAEVTVIQAFTTVKAPKEARVISVTSAEELYLSVQSQFPTSAYAIFTAAVSDYTPLYKNQHKIKKVDSELTIQLKKTPDSLAWAGKNKKVGQTVVGFAMETQDLILNARKKLKSKPCDFIVANTIGTETGGFESDQNTIVIISENREQHFSGLKSDIAYSILKHILE